MDTEREAMFVDVSHVELRQRLIALGAECKQPEYDASRVIFDYDDLRLDSQAAWVRLRKEAHQITLTYKQRQSETIDGMKEIELVVDDYDKTKELLLAIGMSVKSEQQSRRELWQLGRVEVMLDTWPWIPAIVEIEGHTEASVREAVEDLGLDWEKAIFDSIDAVYLQYFDVTRTEICTVPWVFDEVPTWLEQKRK